MRAKQFAAVCRNRNPRTPFCLSDPSVVKDDVWHLFPSVSVVTYCRKVGNLSWQQACCTYSVPTVSVYVVYLNLIITLLCKKTHTYTKKVSVKKFCLSLNLKLTFWIKFRFSRTFCRPEPAKLCLKRMFKFWLVK